MTVGHLLAGVRRFGALLVGVLAATLVGSALVGQIGGDGLRRAVSVGMYLVGSVLVVGALFVSSRPPVRTDRGGGVLNQPMGQARFATAEERRDGFSVAWVLLAVGLVVILVGVLVDGRHALV
jgi:hypothetical protein